MKAAEPMVTLKEFLEAKLEAAQTAVDAAFASSEKAIAKSDINAEKWRENANEWRSAMVDRELKFASRTETENEFKNIRIELATLVKAQATNSGKSEGISATWAVLIAVISVVLAMYGMVRSSPAVAPPAPQVIYVPAPAGALLPTTPPQPAPR